MNAVQAAVIGVDDANPIGQPKAVDARRSPSGLDEAMDRYARGEDVAFDVVFRQAAPRVRGFLLRVCGDPAVADDLTQEAFARIHLARGRFVAGSAALPWMFAIARNALLDGARRDRVRRVVRGQDAVDAAERHEAPPDTRGDEVVQARQTLEIVRRTLERIPRLQREAFVLLRFEGMSVRDASEVLGATESAVKLRAFGAYEAIRAALRRASGEREERAERKEGEGSSRRT